MVQATTRQNFPLTLHGIIVCCPFIVFVHSTITQQRNTHQHALSSNVYILIIFISNMIIFEVIFGSHNYDSEYMLHNDLSSQSSMAVFSISQKWDLTGSCTKPFNWGFSHKETQTYTVHQYQNITGISTQGLQILYMVRNPYGEILSILRFVFIWYKYILSNLCQNLNVVSPTQLEIIDRNT